MSSAAQTNVRQRIAVVVAPGRGAAAYAIICAGLAWRSASAVSASMRQHVMRGQHVERLKLAIDPATLHG
jgi:hypothetical protein